MIRFDLRIKNVVSLNLEDTLVVKSAFLCHGNKADAISKTKHLRSID